MENEIKNLGEQFMIESIERNGTKVVIRIDTGSLVTGHILHFEWEAGTELFAELLVYQLSEQKDKFKLKSKFVHK